METPRQSTVTTDIELPNLDISFVESAIEEQMVKELSLISKFCWSITLLYFSMKTKLELSILNSAESSSNFGQDKKTSDLLFCSDLSGTVDGAAVNGVLKFSFNVP